MIENEKKLTDCITFLKVDLPEGEVWKNDRKKIEEIIEMKNRKMVNQNEIGETGE